MCLCVYVYVFSNGYLEGNLLIKMDLGLDYSVAYQYNAKSSGSN